MVTGCPACTSDDHLPAGLLNKQRYRLRRCTVCRTEFFVDEESGHEPGEDEVYWEGYKLGLYGDEQVQHAFERRYSHVLDLARKHVSPLDSVLDIGCGIGNFVAYAQSSGMRAVGSDVSPVAVAKARERGLKVYEADELSSHVADGSVDALTMWDVVEHLPDPRSVLASVLPAVRPGGAVLFETPDADFPVRAALLGLNRISRGRADLTGPMYYWEHKLYLTETGLRELLDAVGVDLVAVERATSVREKMARQFDVNARKGSRKAQALRLAWPALEAGFRAAGRGNKLLAVGRKRSTA